MKKLTFGSLFAGIGGIDLGLERAGMVCKWQVEIDDYATKVLEKHWPDVTRFRDVRDCGKNNLEPVDLITGGFPCQPHSLAGERKGSDDERDLWPEFARIIRELKPRWVVAENVIGVLSIEIGQYFGGILRDLAACGYDAEWQVLSALFFGASHTRERIFIIAYPSEEGLSGCFFEKGLCRIQGGTSTKFGNRDIACGDWWQENIANIRMGDGFSTKLARHYVGLYGNAVIPQIAEWIGRRIIEFDQDL